MEMEMEARVHSLAKYEAIIRKGIVRLHLSEGRRGKNWESETSCLIVVFCGVCVKYSSVGILLSVGVGERRSNRVARMCGVTWR